MTVLVVEDDPALAELFQRTFERKGHACLVADTMDEAEWTALLAEPDAITLDLSLPGPDPLSWLESLAGSRPDLLRRVTIVTGRLPSDGEAERIAACGVSVVLKPILPSVLVEGVLRRAVQMEAAARDARRHDEAPGRRPAGRFSH